MSETKRAIRRGTGKTSEPQVELKTQARGKGELSCVLVFSERKHVDHIYPLLSQIESRLKEKGFEPQRLGDEIRSGEDYLEKLDKLIQDCVLGVVILDGFRPNVVFEFGFLTGRKKPIIILQSKDACINVHTLYKSTQHVGLTQRSFERLKNPLIDVTSHLSDFAGKHIAYFDWRVRDTDPISPSSVLRKELDKNRARIIAETKNVKSRKIPAPQLPDFLKPLVKTIKYYYKQPSEFSVADLNATHKEIDDIAHKHSVQVPYELYTILAASYTSKAEGLKLDVEQITACLTSAIRIYGEVLASVSVQDNPTGYADTQIKMGDACCDLSEYRDKQDNCRSAIGAYKEALKVYTAKRFEINYARTQNSLGNAYWNLAEVEAEAANRHKAIRACQEALKVYTLDRFPMQYGMTQNNLGNSFLTLAEAEHKAGNCKKAIRAYREALKVYTPGRSPVQYATVQANLGNAYRTLAEAQQKAHNCKKAIKAYLEALRLRKLHRFPIEYADTQNNLGVAYRWLAEVENKAANCKVAIKAFKEALKVRTPNQLPMLYGETQNNLGVAYRTLAEVEAMAENCRRAKEAHERALRAYTQKDSPQVHRSILGNLARLAAFCEGEKS